MRTLIIHNPKSGFGSDAVWQFQRALLKPGDECVMRILESTTDPSDATADAEDFDLVVVSGGDGTAASLLFALRNRNVPTCVFPSGTANLLCANIGNAPEPQALARACRMGNVAKLDMGEISWTATDGDRESHGFALMSGTGFDAQLMQAALPNKKAMGEAAYFAAALANPRPTVAHFSITVDGTTHECDGISCMVANTATIQGDINIVPNCRMDDGQLDVIVITTKRMTDLVRPVLFGLLDHEGNSIGRPSIKSFRGRDIRVESSVPIPIEVDGEVIPGTVSSYEAHVLTHSCTMVVDAMSPYGKSLDKDKSRFGGTAEVAYPEQ